MVVRNSLQLRLKKQVRIPGERWKIIAGTNEKYEVSDHGRVRRVDSGLILTPGNYSGYLGLILTVDGTGTPERIHRLVMETFVGLPPIGYEVNHKDHNPSNNHLSNLEYVTHQENMQHGFHDRFFNTEDIDAVIEMLKRDPRPLHTEIEHQTGVPLSYINNLAKRIPDKGKLERVRRTSSKTRAQRYFEEMEKAKKINMELEIQELLARIDKVTKSVRTGNYQCAIGEQNMIVWRDDPQYNDIHKAITEMIRWWTPTENMLNLFVEYTRPEQKGNDNASL